METLALAAGGTEKVALGAGPGLCCPAALGGRLRGVPSPSPAAALILAEFHRGFGAAFAAVRVGGAAEPEAHGTGTRLVDVASTTTVDVLRERVAGAPGSGGAGVG